MPDSLHQLDPEDRAWAETWIRLQSGLHLVRRHRPRAFAWLVANVPKAAEIATRHGWDNTPRIKRAPTVSELNAVAETLKAFTPHEPTRSTSQQIDALTGIPLRPAHLSPQHLDAINPLPNGRKRGNP